MKLLLISPVEVLARGLESCLSPDIDLVATVAIADAPAAVEALNPDLVLVDFDSDCTFRALSDLVGAGRPVILWVRDIQAEMAAQAIGLGVRGILRKTLGPDLVIRCITQVAAGEVWFEQEVTQSYMHTKRVHLTARQSDVVERVARGMKNGEIAGDLGLSEGTVKVYLSNLFEKLGVKDRYELALYAIKNLGETGRAQAPAGKRGSLRTFAIDRKAA